jgi:hypothetical protein
VVRDAHVDVARGADVETAALQAQDIHARADSADLADSAESACIAYGADLADSAHGAIHFVLRKSSFLKKNLFFEERPNELAKNLFHPKKEQERKKRKTKEQK